jgi:hypothetical protein
MHGLIEMKRFPKILRKLLKSFDKNSKDESFPGLKTSSLEKIAASLRQFREDVRDNIGGALKAWEDSRRKPPSVFAKETKKKYYDQRDLEQTGHRRRQVKVKSKERVYDETPSAEAGLEAQSSLKAHPELMDNPRFDGIDPNVNPEPALNTDARREYDNIKREQELQKQLRLGYMPGMSRKFDPKPTPDKFRR